MYSIIGSAVLIAAALGYAGYELAAVSGAKIDDTYLDQKIDEGIQRYIDKQNEEAAAAQAD